MKKIFKFGCLGVIVLLAIGFVVTMFSDEGFEDITKPEVKKEIVIKEWKTQTKSEKGASIKLLINGWDDPYRSQRFRLNQSIIKLLKKAAKYPETIEVKDNFDKNKWVLVDDYSNAEYISSYSIENIKTGEITISTNFRSENKFGMKVRNILNTTITYDGNTIKFIKVSVN